jgi:hypothetical protein
MSNGDIFVIGAGNYNGTNPTEATKLQDLLGNGEGCTYDKETGSVIIGDPGDLDSSEGSFIATEISEEEIQADSSL